MFSCSDTTARDHTRLLQRKDLDLINFVSAICLFWIFIWPYIVEFSGLLSCLLDQIRIGLATKIVLNFSQAGKKSKESNLKACWCLKMCFAESVQDVARSVPVPVTIQYRMVPKAKIID
ncbi:Uncharacterized protein Adt_11629 [Abeliophyllum distichum]|uniref:Uncharacterized protein n=1 Tax=Abeliophyllum distichum TaxID=126358 RepID=A0ABD1UND7_9LAMI